MAQQVREAMKVTGRTYLMAAELPRQRVSMLADVQMLQ
jgi:hypothetical protein